jgi:hypothetical protein
MLFRPFLLPRLNWHPFTLHTPVFIVAKPCHVTLFTHACRPFFPLISPPCLSAHRTTSPITFLSHLHTLINCLSPNMAKVSFKTHNCSDGLVLKCETKAGWGVLIKLWINEVAVSSVYKSSSYKLPILGQDVMVLYVNQKPYKMGNH